MTKGCLCCGKIIVPPEDGVVKVWLKLNKPIKNPEYEVKAGEKLLVIESFPEPFDALSEDVVQTMTKLQTFRGNSIKAEEVKSQPDNKSNQN